MLKNRVKYRKAVPWFAPRSEAEASGTLTRTHKEATGGGPKGPSRMATAEDEAQRDGGPAAVGRGARSRPQGQAAIELALSLPWLIWLIFYTFNAFHMSHTAHIAQKYSAMSLWERIAYRSKFVVDDVQNQLHNREFMAVEYVGPDGRPVKRKIVLGPSEIKAIVGICREPNCR